MKQTSLDKVIALAVASTLGVSACSSAGAKPPGRVQSIQEPQPREARAGGARPQPAAGGEVESGPLGVWRGTGEDRSLSLRFGSNGSLILNNAAGSEAGSWRAAGKGVWHVSITADGERTDGRFVLVSGSVASLTLGDAHVEMQRAGR